MRPRGAAEPRPLTSWRVLVAILAVVAGTVGLGVWAFQQQIAARVVDTTVQSTAAICSLIIDRNVTYVDITSGMHPADRAALDADLYLLKSRDQVLGLRIWTLEDGSAVYTDVDQPHGDGELAADPLTRARAGHHFAAAGIHPTHGPTIRVYHPYDANGDRAPDAVAEVLLPRQEMDAAIAASTRLLYAGGLLVLLLTVAGIVQVRRRQIAQDHAASHDSLTGLGNRVLLRRRATPLLAAASAEAPVSLLLIDLDGFKGVNDTYGHAAGDELLVAIAGSIARTCRPGDIPIRLGGDEFAVMLPYTAAGTAHHLAEEIRRALRAPAQVAGATVRIDASIGTAWAPVHHTDLSGLLHCADVAMYQAKQTRSGVATYDATTDVRWAPRGTGPTLPVQVTNGSAPVTGGSIT